MANIGGRYQVKGLSVTYTSNYTTNVSDPDVVPRFKVEITPKGLFFEYKVIDTTGPETPYLGTLTTGAWQNPVSYPAVMIGLDPGYYWTLDFKRPRRSTCPVQEFTMTYAEPATGPGTFPSLIQYTAKRIA